MNMGIGEIFHKFSLCDEAREFCGVNLLRHALQGGSKKRFRWSRQGMGYKPRPYNYVSYVALAIEDCLGDQLHACNPFHWDNVELNLRCADDFNPGMTWVYKLNSSVGIIESAMVIFIDSMRIARFSVENFWQSDRRLSSRFQSRGIQEAARKLRPPSLDAHAWASCVVKFVIEDMDKTIPKDKWAKGKELSTRVRA